MRTLGHKLIPYLTKIRDQAKSDEPDMEVIEREAVLALALIEAKEGKKPK